MSKDSAVLRIKPNFYAHVLDQNSNTTRVITGPMTFTRQQHEIVVAGPEPMIKIPPRHYCVIENPVVRKADGSVEHDTSGSCKLKFGDEEIRFSQEPFALYPGEKLSKGGITALRVVSNDCALRLRATRDFTDADGTQRLAGDEWQFKGPGTYKPRVEVRVVEVVKSLVVLENTALKLRARFAFTDRTGTRRDAGEEWLHRSVGSFLPDVNEEVLGVLKATVLTDRKALHLRALAAFTDVFGKKRAPGQEWIVTVDDASAHIPDVYEQVVGEVAVTTLSSRQYCVVCDPVVDGKNQYAKRVLRTGECSFFLNPGERLLGGIQNVHVLGEEEALLLSATEDFVDGKTKRAAGSRWMVKGPRDYIPPLEVAVVERRRTIPLDQNEGIYVRNIKTGAVRAEIGHSYMLAADEELWAKPLPAHVEALLAKQGRDEASGGDAPSGPRDPTRVVTYRAPHNSAVQVYDYKRQEARVAYGPELVMLSPDEEFTVLSLSGSVPKQANKIKSIALLLGPDFMTDSIVVETSDHARLSLKLSYNWYFECPQKVAGADTTAADQALFSVPDFVGDTCKAIASMVRASVAGSTFDDFHKHSASIIRAAAFGRDENGKIRDKLQFSANRLIVTNIDIQSVEPVDQRTRDSLMRSVQLAIEITTQSQEAAARHASARSDQSAKGDLERQKITDEATAEQDKMELLKLQAASAVVEATGQAKAEAKARAESAAIESQAAVRAAQLRAKAMTLAADSELQQMIQRQEAELSHLQRLNELEIEKARRLADIECQKFAQTVEALGPETIVEMAAAPAKAQADLLAGLGLKSVVLSSGDNPINLLGAANGLISQD